jgi:limonene-1,2-epoxide hydrolase
MMGATNERLVQEFCAAWSRRDIEELLAFFTDDAVYHNMPMAPVTGREAIRQVLRLFVPPAERIDWEVRNIAARGAVVLTERVDRFVMSGKRVELPVAGVFEIRGRRIAAWRDYFDLQTWTRQTAAEGEPA